MTVRRLARAARAHWRGLLAGLAVLLSVLGGWWAIPHLEFFRIGAVEVVGLHYLDEQEVVAQLGISAGAHILVPLGPIAARAALVPGLREASLGRRWPGTLRLRVVEALPVAVVVEDGEVRVIADRGEVLPYPPGRVEHSLPLATPDSATAGLLGRLRRADPEWYATFDRAVGGDGEVALVAASGTIRVREDADEALLRRVVAVRQWLGRQGIGWRGLDARFHGRVFVRKDEA